MFWHGCYFSTAYGQYKTESFYPRFEQQHGNFWQQYKFNISVIIFVGKEHVSASETAEEANEKDKYFFQHSY